MEKLKSVETDEGNSNLRKIILLDLEGTRVRTFL